MRATIWIAFADAAKPVFCHLRRLDRFAKDVNGGGALGQALQHIFARISRCYLVLVMKRAFSICGRRNCTAIGQASR